MLVAYKAIYKLEYTYKEIVTLFGGRVKECPVHYYKDDYYFRGICKDSAVRTEVQKQVQKELKKLNLWWSSQEQGKINDFSGFKIIVDPAIVVKPIYRMKLSEIQNFKDILTLADVFTAYREFISVQDYNIISSINNTDSEE